MKRLQAFRFALRPTGDQERTLRQFAGSCRYVYNRTLAIEIARHKSGEPRLGFVGTANILPLWKRDPETVWLSGIHSQILQQALKDIDRAYQNFFEKKAGFPKFRKKGENDAFRYPQGVKLDEPNARIWLPKIGWVRYRKSKEVPGGIKNVTVRRSCEKWYVSIQTEREVPVPVHPNKEAVGLDLGVASFATLTVGLPVPTITERLEPLFHELAVAQKKLSRKEKGSSNWRAARLQVATIHKTIANIRTDFLHKTSTTLAKNHGVIVVEDLGVRNMTRSARGTIENPGKNVRQKAGLNRSILSQGWGTFLTFLSYKLAWAGGQLIKVDPRHTSQTCSACGHVASENRKTQKTFLCVSCNHAENADLNAAKNILARGLEYLQDTIRAGQARSACEVSHEPVWPAAGTRRISQPVTG